MLVFGSLSLDFWKLLEVKQLHYLLHVAHFMREELDYSLVSTDLAKLAHDKEEGLDLTRHIKGLGSYSLTDVDLQEVHDWRNEVLQDWVQHARLLLIFFQLQTKGHCKTTQHYLPRGRL